MLTKRPIVILSCDEHTTPPLDHYRPFLEAKFQAALDEQKKALRPRLEFLKRLASIRPYQYADIDVDDSLKNRGEDGAWDPKKRLQEMDREGIVWGQAHPVANDSRTFHVQPFPSRFEDFAQGVHFTVEQQIAGCRAHNRWMEQFREETSGRVDAAALIGPCEDTEQVVSELHWLAEHGFKTVALPPPPLTSRYDRVWAAAIDLGLNFAAHAGWDGHYGKQERFEHKLPDAQVQQAVATGLDVARLERLRGTPDGAKFLGEAYGQFTDLGRPYSVADIEVAQVAAGGNTFDLNMRGRGPIWQLILSGALDKFPGLRICFTEIRTDWVPDTLRILDERFETLERKFKLKPSEYFRRNFALGGSFLRPVEVAMRHEIGIDQLMFGRDYPHPEGTWPNTFNWIRGAFVDVPEGEARAILGENALKWFGVDRSWAEKIAARIGPRPAELLGASAVLDPARREAMHRILNYNRPRLPVDAAELSYIVDEAIAQVC